MVWPERCDDTMIDQNGCQESIGSQNAMFYSMQWLQNRELRWMRHSYVLVKEQYG